MSIAFKETMRKENQSERIILKSRDKDATQSLTKGFTVNFCPFRPQMSKEIERCIASGKLDNLQSFCNSCLFNIPLKRKEAECRTCYINQGIEKTIRQEKKIAEGESSPSARISPQPAGKN